MKTEYDFLIIGCGAVGLSVGIAILNENPSFKVIIVEKELGLGAHASGRNSGVIHAGFYYSPDSLKAKFCRDGNREITKLAEKYEIPVNRTGKVVVTQHEDELGRLELLFERGIANGVDIEILDASLLRTIEPLARTKEKFIWSPTTGISDPLAILNALYMEFVSVGGRVEFSSDFNLSETNGELFDVSGRFSAKYYINAAGSQANNISKSVGVGTEYSMLPFLGVYRQTNSQNLPLQRLVYPVPHPINPFLGVHFTLTVDGKTKIGPTAIPIFGKEQYSIFSKISGSDFRESLGSMRSLILGDTHSMTKIVSAEWTKFIKPLLIRESAELVPSARLVKDWARKPPGIRAQLVHHPSGSLVQDFLVKHRSNGTHILNAVSPGWTSALPFGRWVAQQAINRSL